VKELRELFQCVDRGGIPSKLFVAGTSGAEEESVLINVPSRVLRVIRAAVDSEDNRFAFGGSALMAAELQRERETTRAPLEALKAIVDCWGVGWESHEKFCKAVEDFMEDGRAAIAKAEAEV
jgi:hypothetical protein